MYQNEWTIREPMTGNECLMSKKVHQYSNNGVLFSTKKKEMSYQAMQRHGGPLSAYH